MSEMIYGQLFCLMIFTMTGIVIGVLFDIFRVLRRSFRTANWITYLQDILFWILTGSIILFAVFTFNHGELRSYVFLGMAFGIILYMITISRFFIRYSVGIIKFLKKILWIPIHFIIHAIDQIMMKPIHFFVINVRKGIINKKKKTTKFKKKTKEKSVKT